MEYTQLGNLDIQISRLCMGCWQAHGWSGSDDATFRSLVELAFENGITFFDTATAYGNGHSEKLLGEALAGIRDKVVIATKAPFQKSDPKGLRESLEASLRALNTDYIDLYQQHWPPKKPALEETISELERLQEQGKIRAIGVSNWMEPEWEEFTEPWRINSLQPCYSLLWRSVEPNVLPLCREHNIAVIPYSPLCQGILAGKFSQIDDLPNDPRKRNRLLTPKYWPAVQKVLETMRTIAQEREKPLSAIALRWLLDQPGITAPIVGCTDPDQLKENLEAVGWSLAQPERALLDAVSRELSEGLKPHDSLWNWHPREQ